MRLKTRLVTTAKLRASVRRYCCVLNCRVLGWENYVIKHPRADGVPLVGQGRLTLAELLASMRR